MSVEVGRTPGDPAIHYTHLDGFSEFVPPLLKQLAEQANVSMDELKALLREAANYSTTSSKIRRLHQDMGLSISETAQVLGIRYQFVYNVIKGKAGHRPKTDPLGHNWWKKV